MSASERVTSLIEITKRLDQIIQQETTLLRQRRSADLGPLQAEKTQLGAAYEEELMIVGKNGAFLTKEAPNEMRELQGEVSHFRKTLDEHGRTLAAAKVVTERLVRNIGEEVARKDRPDEGYSRYARRPSLSRVSRPVSLAINQVV